MRQSARRSLEDDFGRLTSEVRSPSAREHTIKVTFPMPWGYYDSSFLWCLAECGNVVQQLEFDIPSRDVSHKTNSVFRRQQIQVLGEIVRSLLRLKISTQMQAHSMCLKIVDYEQANRNQEKKGDKFSGKGQTQGRWFSKGIMGR